MKSFFVAVLLLITGCIPVIGILDRESPEYVIKQPNGSWLISYGHGGDVGGHLEYREMLERDGNPVVIDGVCDSACTVFYSLPNACLTSNAQMGFHKVTGFATSIWERAIEQHYRSGVLTEYRAVWRFRESVLPRLSRDEMLALDSLTKFCL